MSSSSNNEFVTAIRPCPFSGASGEALQLLGPVGVTQGGEFSSNNFSLVYCEKSDLVFLNPLPTDKDFEVMYSAEQFSSEEYVDPGRIESMMQYYGGCINHHFNLERADTFRLLEVGAGMAWVSRALKGIRADALTRAQDISRECKNKCAWVDEYFVGSVEDFCYATSERFNAISLTHVIEHLPDPVRTLKTLTGVLAPGGVIFVTAPGRPRNWQPSQGLAPWLAYSYLHVPAHITYFSETSLQMAAQMAGLRLTFWDGSHDNGQAFEAVLSPANG
jgi:SAM-dependent methyltransferase